MGLDIKVCMTVCLSGSSTTLSGSGSVWIETFEPELSHSVITYMVVTVDELLGQASMTLRVGGTIPIPPILSHMLN